MKVPSHPGLGNSVFSIVGNQNSFSFLEMFHLIQEASIVLTNWRGVVGF